MIHQRRMRQPLQSFMDGELPEARRAAVARHVERCEACAAALRRLAESDRRLAAARPAVALSPEGAQTLLDRALAEAGVRHDGPRRGWLHLAGAFAVLTAAALGVAWWHPVIRGAGGHPPLHPPGGPRSVASLPPHDPRASQRNAMKEADPLATPVVGQEAAEPRSRHRPAGKPSRLKGDDRHAPPSPSAAPHSGDQPRRTAPRRYQTASAPHLPDRPSVKEPNPSYTSGGLLANQEPAGDPTGPPPAGSVPAPDPTGELLARHEPAGSSGDGASISEPAAAAPGAASPPVEPPGESTTDATLAGSVETRTDEQLGSVADPAPQTPLAGPPAAQLLVVVTARPAPSPVTVTSLPDTAPGYARVIALRPDAGGGLTWTQATTSNEPTGPKLALVMLGSSVPPW